MSFSDPVLDEAKLRITIAQAWRKLGLPNPPNRETGNFRSPFHDDKHPSFSIFDVGRSFKDHAEDIGGDVIDFIERATGFDFKEAKVTLLQMAGLSNSEPFTPRQAKVSLSLTKAPETPATAPPEPIPDEDTATLHEGIEHLLNDPKTCTQIDQWRGWPIGTTATLAEDSLISSPLVRGKRAIAFPVQAPFTDPLGLISTFDVSFHCRHKPEDGERVRWSFHPTGQGSWPFILGGGYITTAVEIHITEGQWDSIALAAHQGWLNTDTSWPDHTVVLGTRGATNTSQLTDHWMTKAPRSAQVRLYPDADKAGENWTQKLATELQKLGFTDIEAFPYIEQDTDLSDFLSPDLQPAAESAAESNLGQLQRWLQGLRPSQPTPPPEPVVYCETCKAKGIAGATIGGPTCQCHIDSLPAIPQPQPSSETSEPASGEITGVTNNNCAELVMPDLGEEYASMIGPDPFSQNSNPEKTRFQLNGHNLFESPLNSITGWAKAGKSSVEGALIAATIAADHRITDADCLGFTAAPTHGKVVLHFDTEQGDRDHGIMARRTLERVGLQRFPQNVFPFALLKLGHNTPEKRKKFIQDAVLYFHKARGVYAVIIDNIAHLAKEANDAESSEAAIHLVNELGQAVGAPVIAATHTQHFTNHTGRGHIGRKLNFMSGTNLIVTKSESTGIYRAFSKNSRDGDTRKENEAVFVFDPELGWDGRHIALSRSPRPQSRTPDAVINVTPSRQPEASQQPIRKTSRKPKLKRRAKAQNKRNQLILGIVDGQPRAYTDLVREIVERTKKSKSTAERWVQEADSDGLITKDSDHKYRSVKAPVEA